MKTNFSIPDISVDSLSVISLEIQGRFFMKIPKCLKKFISISIQQISNPDNDATSNVNKVSYTLLNAKISYNITNNLKLYVSGENILGQNYQVNNFYTMPGATVFSGLAFNS